MEWSYPLPTVINEFKVGTKATKSEVGAINRKKITEIIDKVMFVVIKHVNQCTTK